MGKVVFGMAGGIVLRLPFRSVRLVFVLLNDVARAVRRDVGRAKVVGVVVIKDFTGNKGGVRRRGGQKEHRH